MCGIFGCKLKRELDQSDIDKMNVVRKSMSYRGPDGFGEYIDNQNGLYLGHLRLSIIDLDPRSAQPMARDHLRIVYNGEIYNYLEIQKTLEAEFSFQTSGDTEIILRAWQKDHLAALEMFDGMFAFAVWDENVLTFATDPFGEKPLYIYENEDGIYFASEAGALILAFDLQFRPDDKEISDFLYLGYVRPPSTGFRGLRNVQGASIIKVLPNGELKYSKYWQRPKTYIGKGKIEPYSTAQIDNLRDILCQSLNRRLRADVSKGLFLSGGVDSSLVAALSARELNMPLHAYTVSFEDGADESSQASKIAEHFGLLHTIINSKNDDLWKDAPEVLRSLFGVPNDNMTALSVYQMCKKAKSFLTVAISGLGGDEIFYGYNKYQTLYERRFFYRHSAEFSRFARFLNTFISNSKLSNAELLLEGSQDKQYLQIKNGEMMKYFCQFMPEPCDLLNDLKDDLVYSVREYDLSMSMPQSYIPAIDRGSMRASVEVRTPFLSRKLLEYVSSLDQRALVAFGPKQFAKELLGRYMPLDYLTTGKQGFIYPAYRYYREIKPKVPNIPKFSSEILSGAWRCNNQPELQQMMLRLSLLGNFYER